MRVVDIIFVIARRSQSLFGLCLIGIMGLFALIGPLAAPYDPAAQDLTRILEPPSLSHPLGLDHLGRDVFSRVLHGAPRSLGLALLCITISGGLGTALGLIAAYAGRIADTVIMRFADLMLAFPGILLALFLAGFLGGGLLTILVGINLAFWPQFARMSRAVALGTLQEPHVEAALLAGFPGRTILSRHVLPPVLIQVLPLAMLGLGSVVISISALGFLGLGLQPPTPEWGAMINELFPYLLEAPIQMAGPCLANFTAVLGLTLVGRALVDEISRRQTW